MPKQRPDKHDRAAATVLRFSDDHFWVRVDGDRATIGLSDYGQSDLGEVIAAELPDVSETIERGVALGELESNRTVQELIAPVSGVVSAVNVDIETNPRIINEDPYRDGWLIEVELSDESELEELMSPDEYDDLVSEEESDE